MQYKYNKDLPEFVQNHLPECAQALFREAYNKAYDEYKGPKQHRLNESQEETSHKAAWAAVKEKYSQQGAKWVKKD